MTKNGEEKAKDRRRKKQRKLMNEFTLALASDLSDAHSRPAAPVSQKSGSEDQGGAGDDLICGQFAGDNLTSGDVIEIWISRPGWGGELAYRWKTCCWQSYC